MCEWKMTATMLALTFFSGVTQAGEFSVFCTYKNENIQKCANVISDIVSDKFVEKFSAAKYQIFLHSNIHSFTNGGYSSYAIAGVVQRGSWDFPARYYSNTNINGSDKVFSAVQIAEIELASYRSAAKSLMDACEVSPNCDIYAARGTK